MARYRASIETEWTPEEAFGYLSDFSTSAEWDPRVVEAVRVGAGPVGEGAEFRLVAADPLFALAFNRVGDRALTGLRDVLSRRGPAAVHAAA